MSDKHQSIQNTQSLAGTGSLEPGQSTQFETSTGASMTLTVTNQSAQNVASVQINCSSAKPDTEEWDLAAFGSKNQTKVWGGAPLIVINTTNPNNPATVSVSLQQVS